MQEIKDIFVEMEKCTGRNRRSSILHTTLCLGFTDMSLDQSALSIDKDRQLIIYKNRCSKCYLCKLKYDHIALDANHFPYLTDSTDTALYDLTIDDDIHFFTNLAKFREEPGLSKWIYFLFRLFGFERTYVECAISKEYIEDSILKALGEYRAHDAYVYGKSVIPDVEVNTEDQIFVFENKKFQTTSEDWIKRALEQIILYSNSRLYLEKEEEVYFIISYDGSADIKERIDEILKNETDLQELLENTFREKDNYHLVLLPSNHLYNEVKKALRLNRKEKTWLIDTIQTHETRPYF